MLGTLVSSEAIKATAILIGAWAVWTAFMKIQTKPVPNDGSTASLWYYRFLVYGGPLSFAWQMLIMAGMLLGMLLLIVAEPFKWLCRKAKILLRRKVEQN